MSSYRHTYPAMDYYPSSSHNLPSDLPDLYYDQQDLPSPPSATSSNIISTPPLDWQPWVSVNSKNDNNAPLYQQAPWNLSPLVSDQPIVHPIDTECDWYQPQQQNHHHHQSQQRQQQHYQGSTSLLGPSSMLFSSYEQQQQQPQPSNTISHSGPGAGAQSTASHLGFASVPMAGSAIYSSSPLSHTTPSTPAAATPLPSTGPGSSQATLKLHQPRPSRRIPIISLSKLALACDDFQIYPRQPRDTPSVPGQVNLPFQCKPASSKTYPPMAYHASNQFNKQGLHSRNDIYGMGFPPGMGNSTGRSTQCNCGCMAPYLCQ